VVKYLASKVPARTGEMGHELFYDVHCKSVHPLTADMAERSASE